GPSGGGGRMGGGGSSAGQAGQGGGAGAVQGGTTGAATGGTAGAGVAGSGGTNGGGRGGGAGGQSGTGGTTAPDAAETKPDAAPIVDLAPETAPATNCAAIPKGQLTTRRIPGIEPLEDVTFDDAGNIYWAKASGGIFKTTVDGKTTQLVPRVEVFGGMRMAPDGNLYAIVDFNLEVIAPNGTRARVISGLELNGLEVDPKGRAYVSNFAGTEVLRFDPVTKNIATLTKGIINVPNGLTFNRAFDLLYVNTWDGDRNKTIFQIPVTPEGTAGGPATTFASGVGGGTFDGMGVDECGNVYLADSAGVGEILRFAPDGKSHEVLIRRRGETLHNFVWGRGKGWSETKLYIVSLEEGLFEAELGVRSKKYW
ncbi:MAG TPA: SMP-30/gluconolactonase/LRE family protein, partial [Polyangia bacterium]